MSGEKARARPVTALFPLARRWPLAAGRTTSERFAAVRAAIAGQAAPGRRKARVWLSVAGLPLPPQRHPGTGGGEQGESGRLGDAGDTEA